MNDKVTSLEIFNCLWRVARDIGFAILLLVIGLQLVEMNNREERMESKAREVQESFNNLQDKLFNP